MGTLMVMAMIVVAVLWTKLFRKGKKLRRVELELEAARGSKTSDHGESGALEDLEHDRSV